MINLNKLIAPNSGWTLLVASRINDKGEILGRGFIGPFTPLFFGQIAANNWRCVAKPAGYKLRTRLIGLWYRLSEFLSDPLSTNEVNHAV